MPLALATTLDDGTPLKAAEPWWAPAAGCWTWTGPNRRSHFLPLERCFVSLPHGGAGYVRVRAARMA
jgi:hypothetical protein